MCSAHSVCDPLDYSLLGSSAHGSFQARILEWGALSSSRGSSRPRDQTRTSCVSRICRRILTTGVTWEAPILDSPCPQRIPSLVRKTGTSTNSSDPGQIVTEANWKSQQGVMGSRRQKHLITARRMVDI